MKWAVYAAQVLTGIAGIGAVLVADEITRLHIRSTDGQLGRRRTHLLFDRNDPKRTVRA